MAKNMQVKTVVKMEMLVPLDSDKQATLNVAVSGNVVKTTHTVKPNKNSSNRYNLNWSFDFSNVDQKDILKLAEKGLRITKQAERRKDTDQLNAEKWHNASFMVLDMLNEGRKTADPVKKAETAIRKLSQEELQEIFEKYVKG
jgi:hypothetical protein